MKLISIKKWLQSTDPKKEAKVWSPFTFDFMKFKLHLNKIYGTPGFFSILSRTFNYKQTLIKLSMTVTKMKNRIFNTIEVIVYARFI